jgi:hypothetical protein
MRDGQRQAEVPDTLDLAEHGRLAINGMLGSLNPALDYECAFLNILDVHPAYMLHWSSMVSGVMPKYLEALPLLRQMSGSDPHEHPWYRLFRRDAMKAAAAPAKPMPAYVHPDRLIDWLMLA